MTQRSSRASRSSSSRAPRERADGRVDVACPQCGAQYRVTKEALDEKLECGDCHRVFFPKTTAGKRVAPPDYTKTYVGVGVAVLRAPMVVMSGGGGEKRVIMESEPAAVPHWRDATPELQKMAD
ncbi:MAG: hypothetical protein ACK6D1_02540 [Planctomycetota bacterium]